MLREKGQSVWWQGEGRRIELVDVAGSGEVAVVTREFDFFLPSLALPFSSEW